MKGHVAHMLDFIATVSFIATILVACFFREQGDGQSSSDMIMMSQMSSKGDEYSDDDQIELISQPELGSDSDDQENPYGTGFNDPSNRKYAQAEARASRLKKSSSRVAYPLYV